MSSHVELSAANSYPLLHEHCDSLSTVWQIPLTWSQGFGSSHGLDAGKNELYIYYISWIVQLYGPRPCTVQKIWDWTDYTFAAGLKTCLFSRLSKFFSKLRPYYLIKGWSQEISKFTDPALQPVVFRWNKDEGTSWSVLGNLEIMCAEHGLWTRVFWLGYSKFTKRCASNYCNKTQYLRSQLMLSLVSWKWSLHAQK